MQSLRLRQGYKPRSYINIYVGKVPRIQSWVMYLIKSISVVDLHLGVTHTSEVDRSFLSSCWITKTMLMFALI